MNISNLTNPEIQELHSLIMGDYEGAYSLSFNEMPPEFTVKIENKNNANIPTQINWNEQTIPVKVVDGFKQPKPL